MRSFFKSTILAIVLMMSSSWLLAQTFFADLYPSEMPVGSVIQINYGVNPPDNVFRTYNFTSSDTSVAMVSDAGLITSVDTGSVTISVTCDSFPDEVKSLSVHFKPNANINPYFTESSMSVREGTTVSLPLDSSLNSLYLIFQYAGKDIVSLDTSNNTVTGLSAGTVILYAYDNNKSFVQSLVISVLPIVKEEVLVYPVNISLADQDTALIIARVLPDTLSNKTITFTSSNDSVATVDANGIVTGHQSGVAIITATSNNGKTATVNVTVNNPRIFYATVSKQSIEIGDTTIVRVYLNGNEVIGSNSLYINSSSDSIATLSVSPNMIITGKRKGNYTITFSYTGYTTTLTVEVKDTAYYPTAITSNITSTQMTVGDTMVIPFTIIPLNPDNQNITFTSSNDNISVTKGSGSQLVIRAISPGETVITATTFNGLSVSVFVDVLITVQPTFTASISKNQLHVGDTANVSYKLTGVIPANRSTLAVFTSSDANIATVDSKGIVYAIHEGTATITAQWYEYSTSFTITVINNIPQIQSINIINNGYILEITFSDTISLYQGIENDFVIIMISKFKSAGEYNITRVMAKENDPYTLVLVLDSPVPNDNISVSFKDATTFNASTSVVESGKSEIKAYPNPATDVLIFEAENLTKVEIVTFDGKTIQTATSSSDKAELSVENLARGLYVAKVTCANGTSNMIIEKK